MELNIDPALIARVPPNIETAISVYAHHVSCESYKDIAASRSALGTLIGALVRERDEERTRADGVIDALVKAGQVAGYSVDKKPSGIQTLHEYLETLVRELDELRVSARRYETVRKLNPREFSELYQRNITSGERFDDLVDALAVDKPAIKPYTRALIPWEGCGGYESFMDSP